MYTHTHTRTHAHTHTRTRAHTHTHNHAHRLLYYISHMVWHVCNPAPPPPPLSHPASLSTPLCASSLRICASVPLYICVCQVCVCVCLYIRTQVHTLTSASTAALWSPLPATMTVWAILNHSALTCISTSLFAVLPCPSIPKFPLPQVYTQLLAVKPTVCVRPQAIISAHNQPNSSLPRLCVLRVY